ncbi:energy transducer TonB [Chondrinema litorale]|uniref:energy transducer TonB n=1 Tax=Chondrinema litorale TaxID=2994555 RepID=UPI002543F1E7|nr:TonB family protein [Chondrinema litorale]UZR94500.1 TonB family protein [Chondrinema litorale]
MSKEQFHSDPQLAEVIENYLSGSLSHAEMHQLELKMLDDPFLADAVEGLALISDAAKRNKIIEDIRQQISSDKKEDKVIYFTPARYAAAAVILLMIASVFIFQDEFFKGIENKSLSEIEKTEAADNFKKEDSSESVETEQDELNKESDEQNIALENQAETQALESEPKLNEEDQKYADINEQLATRQRQLNEQALNTEKQREINASQRSRAKEEIKMSKEYHESAPIIGATKLEEKELQIDSESISLDIEEVQVEETDLDDDSGLGYAVKDINADDIAKDSISNKRRPILIRGSSTIRSKKQASDSGISQMFNQGSETITGVVTGDNNEPLVGVNVIVKGSTIGTTTNIDGEFKLEKPVGSNTLELNYIGYLTEEIELDSGETDLLIAMNEDTQQLEEIVVVGYGVSKKENIGSSVEQINTANEEAKPDVIVNAKPEDGMKSLHQFIKEQIQIPVEAQQNDVKGTVKLSFRVNTNGSISNIKVEKSLGYGCDEEAIRLLKDGPKWKAKTINGNPVYSEQTIKIRFKQ